MLGFANEIYIQKNVYYHNKPNNKTIVERMRKGIITVGICDRFMGSSAATGVTRIWLVFFKTSSSVIDALS